MRPRLATPRVLALVLAFAATLTLAAPARADLVLSFDKPSYSITGVGNTTSVDVLVSQNATGNQVSAADALLTASVLVTINSPTGVVNITAVTGGALWDSASSSITATNASLATLSLGGIGSLPAKIGTFTFKGLLPGTTTIKVAVLDPTTVNFITTGFDIADPTNTAIASITVVPEPSPLALGLITLGLAVAARKGKTALRAAGRFAASFAA